MSLKMSVCVDEGFRRCSPLLAFVLVVDVQYYGIAFSMTLGSKWGKIIAIEQ